MLPNVVQYFTFGLSHPMAKFHVKIKSYSRMECRQEMFNMFGAKWAFQYDDEPTTTEELPLIADEFGQLRLVLPS